MKLDDVNRWMNLAASVGVIAGLFLLAFELQQNREMVRAQTRNDIALGVMDMMALSASNPQLASVHRRGDAVAYCHPVIFSLIPRQHMERWA